MLGTYGRLLLDTQYKTNFVSLMTFLQAHHESRSSRFYADDYYDNDELLAKTRRLQAAENEKRTEAENIDNHQEKENEEPLGSLPADGGNQLDVEELYEEVMLTG